MQGHARWHPQLASWPYPFVAIPPHIPHCLHFTSLQAELPQFLSCLSCLCLLPGSQATRGIHWSGLSDRVRATPNSQLPVTPGWLGQKCLEPSVRHCSLTSQGSCLGAHHWQLPLQHYTGFTSTLRGPCCSHGSLHPNGRGYAFHRTIREISSKVQASHCISAVALATLH